MIIIAETLTNVTSVDHDQYVRQQTLIKTNNTYNLIQACYSINAHQRNTPVENWDRVKYCWIKKRPKKGTMAKSN